MSCKFPACKITDEEELIVCRICEGLFHGACVGLNSHVVEALKAKVGLNWCCSDCKAADSEALKSVRAARKDFLKIRGELSDIVSKFNQMEDNFKFLKSFEPIEFGIKSKKLPKNKKLSLPKTSSVATTPVTEGNLGSVFATPLSDPVVIEDSPSVAPSNASQKSSSKNLNGNLSGDDESVSYSQVLRMNAVVAESIHSDNSNEAGSSHRMVTRNSSKSVKKSSTKTNKTRNSSSKSSAASGTNTSRSVKALTFVDRKKYVFVSRLAADTHADDVKLYITNKLKIDSNSSEIKVIKLNSIYKRNIASFKIGAPAHLFDKIVDGSFWPSNAIFHEFEFRAKSNEIAALNTEVSPGKN